MPAFYGPARLRTLWPLMAAAEYEECRAQESKTARCFDHDILLFEGVT